MEIPDPQPFIDTPERLGEVVRNARKDAGMTQAQLAAKAGVSRQFLIEVEAGHPRAELDKVLAVLRALDIQPRAVPVVDPWAFAVDGSLREDLPPLVYPGRGASALPEFVD